MRLLILIVDVHLTNTLLLFDLIIVVFAKTKTQNWGKPFHIRARTFVITWYPRSRGLRTVGLGYVLSNLKVTTLKWLHNYTQCNRDNLKQKFHWPNCGNKNEINQSNSGPPPLYHSFAVLKNQIFFGKRYYINVFHGLIFLFNISQSAGNEFSFLRDCGSDCRKCIVRTSPYYYASASYRIEGGKQCGYKRIVYREIVD